MPVYVAENADQMSKCAVFHTMAGGENRGIGSVDGVKKQERHSAVGRDFQQIHRQRRRGILMPWKSRLCLPER